MLRARKPQPLFRLDIHPDLSYRAMVNFHIKGWPLHFSGLLGGPDRRLGIQYHMQLYHISNAIIF